MVLDDPVTSLDHIDEGRVAQRSPSSPTNVRSSCLTHDVSLLATCVGLPTRLEAGFIERSVHRRGDGAPGCSLDQHPWKRETSRHGFNELERLLAEIKKERVNWSQDQYEEKCADCGKLSETWSA